MKNKIYLDYASTTPVDYEVFKAMRSYLIKDFGNPMSVHSFGQKALQAVNKARQQVADFLGAKPQEIIFTSGATESNNLALKGVVRKIIETHGSTFRPHIITSSIEHHCVLETCKSLEKDGVEVTYLPVTKEGLVKVKDVKEAIKKNTILISIMYANNEIGTIQPIREIGKLIKEVNKLRIENNKSPILFHTDAVQALNYLNCNVDYLNVNLLSLSGHKIYGPKGIGALYIRKGTPIVQIQNGGEQEYGLRAGTHNVAGIVGLGEAISNIKYQKSEIKNIKLLRDKLIKNILTKITNSQLNGSRERRLPNNANFSFKNVEGESLVLNLDLEGFATSTGSACSSGSLKPSHVIMALGMSHEEAHSSLRITLGKYTTEKEINEFLKVLPSIIKRLRKIAPKN